MTSPPSGEFAAVLHENLAAAQRLDLFVAVINILGPLTTGGWRATAGAVTIDIEALRDLVRTLGRSRGLDVLDVILTAAGPHLPRPVAPIPAQQTRTGAARIHADLTVREAQVLAGIVDGLTNSEIGRRLGLSEDTVKTHVRRLFRKLGIRRRAEAVRLVCEREHAVAQPAAVAS